jgi:hypothetical protein
VRAVVVKSEGVAVYGPRVSEESWICDSSRSLSKSHQLASNSLLRTQASGLTEIDQALVENM